MDAIPSQYQTIAKAGIAGGVAAVAAGLLQSGTSPLVPIFVGGTVVAITHFALTGIEKTQLAARKALKKASKSDKKSKADTKSDKKGKKSDKKSEKGEDEEEQPEEVEEQPVEPKKAGKKQPKKEEKKPAGKKEEAKKAPKAEEKKAAPKAAAKQAAAPAPAAAPKKGAKAEAKAAAPAKAPAKAAPKAEAKKAAKVEAAPKKGAKAEAPAPEAKAAKNKKKKAPKVVEPVEEAEDDDEEEEQEGWITQKTKARKPSEKATARVAVKQQQEEDDEEKEEEGPKEETVTFSLPRASHAAIFGEKGNTIAKIQQVTGTRVKMPAKESKEDNITIRGSGDGIKLAQQIMQDVATQGFSTVLNPNLVKVEINVPSEKQGGLIGKSGENIRLIQQKTDTKINIPKKEDKSRIITIVGPPEGVKAAQAAIKSILAHGFADITHPDHVKETISIPRDQTRLLIGPQGATIKAIQTSSNVKINIPDSETEEQKREPNQVLTITGPAPNVRAAKNAILMSIQPLEDETPDANSPWAGSMDYSEDAQWE